MNGGLQIWDWGKLPDSQWIRSASSPRVDMPLGNCECIGGCRVTSDCGDSRLDMGWAAAFMLSANEAEKMGAAPKCACKADCRTPEELRSPRQYRDSPSGRVAEASGEPYLIPYADPWLPGTVDTIMVAGAGPATQKEVGRVPMFIEAVWPTDPFVESSNPWLASLVRREDAIGLTRARSSPQDWRGTEVTTPPNFGLPNDVFGTEPPLLCSGHPCTGSILLTEMAQDWVEAGGLARELVEVLQYMAALEVCTPDGQCAAETGFANKFCTVIRSEILYFVIDTTAEKDFFERYHVYTCCCTAEEVIVDPGPGRIPPDTKPA